MDDNTFDDLIKKKLEDHQDNESVAGIPDSLHERLVGADVTQWFNSSFARTAAFSSLIVLTLLNIYFLSKSLAVSPTGDQAVITMKVDSLSMQVRQLQYELQEAKKLHETQVQQIREVEPETRTIAVANIKDYVIHIKSLNELPDDLVRKLSQIGVRWVDDDQGMVLTYQPPRHEIRDVHVKPYELDVDRTPALFRKFVVVGVDNETTLPAIHTSKQVMTLSTVKALEKHYYSGVGIKLGGHLDAMKNFFSNGQGGITPRVGVAAEWVVSPVLSVETGFDYLTTSVDPDKGSQPYVDHNNPYYGTPVSETFVTKLGAMPVAIKYRQWITGRNQAFIKVGATPFLSFSRENQLSYQINDNSPDHDYVQVTTLEKQKDVRYYGTTIATSIGITSQRMKDKKRGEFETSLFYEHSVGQVGKPGQNMQLIGLRAAYWIKMK